MLDWADIYERAVRNKGEAHISANLPKPRSQRALSSTAPASFLSEMSGCVFRAGFSWSVVEKKWPGFEAAFNGFDTNYCARLSDEDFERLMQNPAIIRNGAKLKTIRHNAQLLLDLAGEHGSAGKFFAQWPVTEIVDLWDLLKKRGSRLGGNSGPMFLRFTGKDTFMLTNDVVAMLVRQGVVDKAPGGKKALQQCQLAFNQWHEESGRPMCEISRVLAYAHG